MTVVDAVIVGAGPAGCSAASWLAQLGLSVALLERGAQPCASLVALDYEATSVLGAPPRTLREISQDYAAHLAHQPGVALCLNRELTALRYLSDEEGGGWAVEAGADRFQASCLVLATGLRPRRPAQYFNLPDPAGRVLDAIGLTRRRAALPPGRVLLLGGGDNAVENALYLHARGHRVTLCTRTGWRAQPGLLRRLQATPGIEVRLNEPLPQLVAADAGTVRVHSAAQGDEAFDTLAVLFGYEAETGAFALAREALRAAGLPLPVPDLDAQLPQLPQLPAAGLFVAGDASARLHPCVQSALADGVTAAKQVQHRVQHPVTLAQARGVLQAAAAPARCGQVLRLDGLRCNARLGWLDREKHAPQPIQVDAEINMGTQPLLPTDDDLAHVLDYRQVRQILIDESNSEHVHLIETLLGKLCLRLLGLPGVLGVRVRVTKLEIFDDCTVSMSAEHGQW